MFNDSIHVHTDDIISISTVVITKPKYRNLTR